MVEINTGTTTTPAVLDERVARLRAKLRSTPQGHQIVRDLSPVSMVKTDHDTIDFASRDIVDFTDWRQWGQQWSQYH